MSTSAGQEADVRQAALEDVGWDRGRLQYPGRLVLDHRPLRFDHHVAARTLGQAIAALEADHLVVVGVRPLQFIRQDLDDFDRNVRTEAQALIGDGVLPRLLPTLGFRRRGVLDFRRLGNRHAQRSQEARLDGRIDAGPLLGLRSEDLALEPRQLPFERIETFLARPQLLSKLAILGFEMLVLGGEFGEGQSVNNPCKCRLE